MKNQIKAYLVIGIFCLSSCDKKEERKNKETKSPATTTVDNASAKSEAISPKSEAVKEDEVVIPEQIKPKPADDNVKRTVKEFLVSMRKAENLVDFSFEQWDEHWIAEFDEPLEKSSSEISQDLEKYADNLMPDLAMALPQSKEEWMKDDEMRQSAIILMGLVSTFIGDKTENSDGGNTAGNLPELIGGNQNRTPPGFGDLLLLRIVAVSKLLLEHSPNMTEAQFSDWSVFAEAQNPIYRMIALDLFGSFQSTAEQEKLFYESFGNESERGILKKMNQNLRAVEEEWAQALSRDIADKLQSP